MLAYLSTQAAASWGFWHVVAIVGLVLPMVGVFLPLPIVPARDEEPALSLPPTDAQAESLVSALSRGWESLTPHEQAVVVSVSFVVLSTEVGRSALVKVVEAIRKIDEESPRATRGAATGKAA